MFILQILFILIVIFVIFGYLRAAGPIIVKFTLNGADAKIPTKAYHRAACFDLYATESHSIPSGQWREFETGVAFAPWPHIYIPKWNLTITPLGNVAAKIYTRSGHGIKRGLRAHLGVIDNDYRNTLTVCLYNHNQEHAVRIKKGDKVGQIEFYRVPSTWLWLSKKLSDSARREQGLGSSGR